MRVKFVIPGEPKGKGRPRVERHGDRTVTRTPPKMARKATRKALRRPGNCSTTPETGITPMRRTAIPTAPLKAERMRSNERAGRWCHPACV